MQSTAPQTQNQTQKLNPPAAQRGFDGQRSITESTFEEVPVGAEFRLRAVSFLKLSAGDFILVSSNRGYLVRRFLRVSKSSGNTRLVVIDGVGNREELPFVRLLGLLTQIKEKEAWVDPNPQSALSRAGYALYGLFTRNTPAA